MSLPAAQFISVLVGSLTKVCSMLNSAVAVHSMSAATAEKGEATRATREKIDASFMVESLGRGCLILCSVCFSSLIAFEIVRSRKERADIEM